MAPDPRFQMILDNPLGQRVMGVIKAHGGEARFVGGIVRDALAGIAIKPNADLDMAMDITPSLAMEALQKDGLRVLPTGIDHGTITVFDRRNADQKIEMTTLRADIDTDGRHADVAFTQDWQGDAARRDFTINSLYLDGDGQLYDPFHGADDLIHGRVKFIGDAAARLAEDYLRMLRFFRFQSRFGKGAPDQDALAAIRDAAPNLDRISGERQALELSKLLPLGASSGLNAMQDCGIDRIIMGGSKGSRFNIPVFENVTALCDETPLAAAYAALIPEGCIADVMERLKLSMKLRRQITYMAMPIDDIDRLSGADWQKTAWQNKPHPNADQTDLAWRYAISQAHLDSTPDQARFSELRAWTAPKFPVTGANLMAKGIKTGPEMGLVLEKLENHWASSGFCLSRDDLLLLLD